MNRKLYSLCLEYMNCYGILQTLISMDGIDHERLKIFRVTADRIHELEKEMETVIVENDLENNMMK